jgi:DNA-binding transcriptional ArsR family regulator
MKTTNAVAALAALAQESRLAVFRLLVRNAPEGLTPGLIGEQLELPAPTLSFHLKNLAQAGLVTTVQEGRYVRYRAEMPAINALIDFLTEDCCAGNPDRCSPKGKTHA